MHDPVMTEKHLAGLLEFEQRSAQHLVTMLGITREFEPAERSWSAPGYASGSVLCGLVSA